MKKVLLTILAAGLLCTAAPAHTALAGPQDMAKITCKEFLEDKANMPMMIMWIDGYMSAKSDNTLIDDKWIEKLGMHLGSYCTKSPSKTIMNAIEDMPAAG